MKHICIVVLILLFGGKAMAQPASGKLFLGGNMSVYSMKDKSKIDATTQDNEITTTVDVLPGAGYFLGERLAAGAYLGMSAEITRYPDPLIGDPEKYTALLYSVNPFLRYYLISGQAGIFAEASFESSFGNVRIHFTGGSYDYKATQFSAGIIPGVYYYISEKLALEAKIGWMGFVSETLSDEDDNKNNVTGFGFDLYPANILFGVTFTL
ncbi:MAG: outer membrane beta-barrel protein [Bacteroidales bacterium]|nr:outer membrane beta-barrel protein [Bacteroidales bacterium]